YGSKEKYHHELKGVNSRVDELQAAFLRAKLKKLDEWNGRRREISAIYLDGLSDTHGVVLPFNPDWAEPVYHLFVIRHPQRELLQKSLSAAGISTLIHYPTPSHLSAAYADRGWQRGDFPVAEQLAETVLSL